VEARFSAPAHTGTGAHPASCTMDIVSLSREVEAIERLGRDFDHSSKIRGQRKSRAVSSGPVIA